MQRCSWGPKLSHFTVPSFHALGHFLRRTNYEENHHLKPSKEALSHILHVWAWDNGTDRRFNYFSKACGCGSPPHYPKGVCTLSVLLAPGPNVSGAVLCGGSRPHAQSLSNHELDFLLAAFNVCCPKLAVHMPFPIRVSSSECKRELTDKKEHQIGTVFTSLCFRQKEILCQTCVLLFLLWLCRC